MVGGGPEGRKVFLIEGVLKAVEHYKRLGNRVALVTKRQQVRTFASPPECACQIGAHASLHMEFVEATPPPLPGRAPQFRRIRRVAGGDGAACGWDSWDGWGSWDGWECSRRTPLMS